MLVVIPGSHPRDTDLISLHIRTLKTCDKQPRARTPHSIAGLACCQAGMVNRLSFAAEEDQALGLCNCSHFPPPWPRRDN